MVRAEVFFGKSRGGHLANQASAGSNPVLGQGAAREALLHPLFCNPDGVLLGETRSLPFFPGQKSEPKQLTETGVIWLNQAESPVPGRSPKRNERRTHSR